MNGKTTKDYSKRYQQQPSVRYYYHQQLDPEAVTIASSLLLSSGIISPTGSKF
jgi:hypothetical protein